MQIFNFLNEIAMFRAKLPEYVHQGIIVSITAYSVKQHLRAVQKNFNYSVLDTLIHQTLSYSATLK